MPLSHLETRGRLRSVSAGLLSPFDADLQVDYEKLQANSQMLYDSGIRSFLAVANISEYHSLSRTERVESANAVVEALPSNACVLAGAGGSTGDATNLIREYDRVGVDAMMIMPPDHAYVHEQGLLEYYRALADTTDRPLVPYIRGFDPSLEFLVQLTNLDDVVAIKYALNDTVKLASAVKDRGYRRILCGRQQLPPRGGARARRCTHRR